MRLGDTSFIAASAHFEVKDLEATADKLISHGVHFRNATVTGNGGKQVLIEDPSGNPIELFQTF